VGLRVDEVEMPSGRRTTREVVEHPDAVVVVPLDDEGGVYLVRQFRQAVEKHLLELPAGGIERLVSSHPAVTDVAVIGMPDQALGERICAYIQLRPGASLTFEELIAYLKRIGASVLQLPERVEFVDWIPTTSIGKADKKLLKEDLKKRLGLV